MTAIALGCSQTAGIGLEVQDRYTTVLSKLLNTPIEARGVNNGNAAHVQSNLVQVLKTQRPDFVIAQWPSPIRRTVWNRNTVRDENINNASPAFQKLLDQSEKNFYQPWIDTIVVCNLLCELAGVPIVNIMLHDIPQEYHDQLALNGIVLHVDKKLPDQTWLMDSGASDNLHHSATCHKQWAQRLFGLINELTTP
jgi:lysophospholipase L1-like esterase